MKYWTFAGVWTPNRGFETPFALRVDSCGKIVESGPLVKPQPNDIINEFPSEILIPGLISGHSHAFQYAMAGSAEALGLGASLDDFWSWREQMYRLALSLNPDELESIATMAYSEMLRFGLTHVVEFHYLHHDRSGSPYADPTELSQRLVAAAKHAGINLCLVPIFYQLSGFGEVAKPEQRRFVFKSLDQYMDVIRRLEPLTANLGIGVHSLRAADSDSCKAILNFQGSYPTHIHLAEQAKEVDACRAHYGCEPLRWILDHVELKEKHALTHVTHTTTADLLALARSKAVTILCPTTEANLGDGIFPLLDYHQAGGRWCTGSDSQVSLNPCEELRWLDYQLRLKHQRRNPLCANPEDESGTLLLRNHIQYGSQVFYGKSKTEFFQANETFSGLSLDLNHPVLLEKPLEKILSSFVFTSDPSAIAGTITAGEWQVRGGRHRHKDSILKSYGSVLEALLR